MSRFNHFFSCSLYRPCLQQDYMLSVSKRTQKLQNAIVSLCDQKQQKLDELSNQREEMVWKHKEQVNGMFVCMCDQMCMYGCECMKCHERHDVKSLLEPVKTFQ